MRFKNIILIILLVGGLSSCYHINNLIDSKQYSYGYVKHSKPMNYTRKMVNENKQWIK